MNIILSILSAILLSLPWMGITSLSLLFALVPLLLVQQRTKGKRFWLYVILTTVLWNLITVWWITISATIGLVAAIIVHTILVTIAMQLYSIAKQKAKRALAYTILVCGWVAFEYIYINGEISFPWLTIGNGFAIDVKIIQWYEYFGALGGSMWALTCNVLLLNTYNAIIKHRNNKISKDTLIYKCCVALSFIIIPIIISINIYNNYKEVEDPVKVTVIQPNIDPYTEKFNGMSAKEQLDRILELSSKAPKDVAFIVTPETAIDDDLWIESINSQSSIIRVKDFMNEHYPNTDFIAGASLFKWYAKTNENISPSVTARLAPNNLYYYDIYNSALVINSNDSVGIYHKSKLVIGVEMLPYHEYIGGIVSKLSVNLGGISGMLATQEERTVFEKDNTKFGVAICYESIYGEFFSEFALKGADIMFVITNDGWWDDTYGHRQHFSYSRLRAIETRRSIARSANTGISGFINQRGEIVSSLGWDKRGILTNNINRNKEITFFTQYGDMPGRIACYVFILSILYLISYIRKKKDYLL